MANTGTYVHHLGELPNGIHWVILTNAEFNGQYNKPNDTHLQYLNYIVFTDKGEFETELKKRTEEHYQSSNRYQVAAPVGIGPVTVLRPKVEVSVKVDLGA